MLENFWKCSQPSVPITVWQPICYSLPRYKRTLYSLPFQIDRLFTCSFKNCVMRIASYLVIFVVWLSQFFRSFIVVGFAQ